MGVQADSTPGGVSPLRKFLSSVRVGASRRAGHSVGVPACSGDPGLGIPDRGRGPDRGHGAVQAATTTAQ
jgi:hypothetical protein